MVDQANDHFSAEALVPQVRLTVREKEFLERMCYVEWVKCWVVNLQIDRAGLTAL